MRHDEIMNEFQLLEQRFDADAERTRIKLMAIRKRLDCMISRLMTTVKTGKETGNE